MLRIDFGDEDANPLYRAHHLYFGHDEASGIQIPSNFTRIKDFTFIGATSLTSVKIPSSVTSIGMKAFAGCDNLRYLEIGENVKETDYYAFNECYADVIVCKAVTPPTILDENGIGDFWTNILIVPKESIYAYETWSGIEANCIAPILDVMFLEEVNKSEYQNELKRWNKSAITSVGFYGGTANDLTEEDIKQGMNPNCLYLIPFSHYNVMDENYVVLNYIIQNSAESIKLVDGYPFDSPVAFEAEKIEYVHTPKVWANGTGGWETICLPFSVEEFEASERGTIFPIRISSKGNFWLRRYTGSTDKDIYFASTTDGALNAYTPYLIAFPGKTMGFGHLEGQTITFRAYYQEIDVTWKTSDSGKGKYEFVCNFDSTPDGISGWVLNDSGSMFVQNDVVGNNPFQPYFTSEGLSPAKNLNINFGTYDETTGIFTPEVESSESGLQGFYDLSGRKIDAASAKKGIYIKNGKKVVF